MVFFFGIGLQGLQDKSEVSPGLLLLLYFLARLQDVVFIASFLFVLSSETQLCCFFHVRETSLFCMMSIADSN